MQSKAREAGRDLFDAVYGDWSKLPTSERPRLFVAVWWSPHLIFSQPDWIGEPPGKGVLKGMVWMPVVTFWQVTADLPFATGVPAGYGHKYTAEYVDGWNTVMRPAGITSQDLASLRNIIAAEG